MLCITANDPPEMSRSSFATICGAARRLVSKSRLRLKQSRVQLFHFCTVFGGGCFAAFDDELTRFKELPGAPSSILHQRVNVLAVSIELRLPIELLIQLG